MAEALFGESRDATPGGQEAELAENKVISKSCL
jgi:hypothetical protein